MDSPLYWVVARGKTIKNEFGPSVEESTRQFGEADGETLRTLNKSLLEDPRIDALIIPLFEV